MILATFEALKVMNSPKNVADRRSKHVSEIIKRRNVLMNNNSTDNGQENVNTDKENDGKDIIDVDINSKSGE
jgi:hypothetical protein